MLNQCHVFKTTCWLRKLSFYDSTSDNAFIKKKKSFIPQKLINRKTYITENVLRKHSKLDKDVNSAHTSALSTVLSKTNTRNSLKSQRLTRRLRSPSDTSVL